MKIPFIFIDDVDTYVIYAENEYEVLDILDEWELSGEIREFNTFEHGDPRDYTVLS